MDDVKRLLIQAQSGDRVARDELVENNLGLVRHIVKRFINRGYDAEDLFQIGCIGLIKAIDKFDCNYDVKFSTYAVPMIMGEIKRFLRDDGMIKVSRTLKENGARIKQAKEALSYEYNRDATLSEIADETGLTTEEIVMALEANVEVESIYKTIYKSDGNEIFLADKVAANEKYGISHMLDHILLKEMLDRMEDREKQLIVLRYYQDKTQVEVADRLGISQVQVSRLEKKILLRMREVLR